MAAPTATTVYRTTPERVFIAPGEYGVMEIGYSEAAMHLRVAGKTMLFLLLDRQYPMVQLYDDDGHDYSFPILPGEAGLYSTNADGTWQYYYYPNA